MRITVDIDENDLEKIQNITGIKKRSPAVRHVVESYLREMEKKRFLQRVLDGKTDYTMTNEELEETKVDDTD